MLNSFRKLFYNRSLRALSFVYFGALFNGLSLFLVNVFLGRALGKDFFATFSLSIMVLSTVAELSDLGLNGGLLRFAPYYLATDNQNKLKQLVKIVWDWRVRISFFLTVGGILFSYPLAKYAFGQPLIWKEIAFSFLGIGGVVLLGFVNTYMQAKQAFVASAKFQIVKGLARLILVGIFVIVGIKSVYLYLLVYISVPWILFFPAYKFLPTGFCSIDLSQAERKKISNQLTSFSIWLAVWSLAAIITTRIDQVFISRMLGLDDVANFYVAFQFVSLYALVSQSITTVLIPKISAIVQKDELVRMVRRIYGWLCLGILILLPLIYPSQFLIGWLFGDKYSASMILYVNLSYAMTFSFLNIPLSLIITYFKKTNLYAISALLGFLVSLIFNYIFIYKFGVLGATYTFAMGIAFTLLFNLICSVYLIKRVRLEIV